MVGGKVVDKWVWNNGEIELAVLDEGDYCGLKIEKNENSLCILVGDSVWWQGRKLMWTPKDGSMQDVMIPRIGYSFRLKDGQTLTNGRLEWILAKAHEVLK